jgi:ornithine cyclodeaminase/alanine dehydrogenase-like protein (mu-crystallin family)
MNRRQFLKLGSAAAITLSAASYIPTTFAVEKAKRVGLIGTGWYGKADLLRLIQVAPVEVVSLCDVDKHMLAEAADLVATRQASKEEAAHLWRLSRDAQGARPRHRADRAAGPLARACR